MDWRYMHFGGTRTYLHPQGQVQGASRGFVAEDLGWKITDTADGFKATGVSFWHAAIADFHVAWAPDGAQVTVELAVERASYLGYALADLGGAFSGQIAHWLEGIGDRLEGRVGANAPHRPPSAGARLMSAMLLVAILGFGIWGGWTLVFAPIIGITTGVLYLPGRGGGLTLHGDWARGVSVAIFALDAFIAYRIFSRRRRQARPKILGRE